MGRRWVCCRFMHQHCWQPHLLYSSTHQLHVITSAGVVQVQLQSGRVIEGDFVCLDPQGNIILANASEHIKAAQNGSSNSSSLGKSSNGPALNHLGMVLVPKAQHKEVLMEVTLSEKASVMSLVGSS
eukprot:GHUV01017184.1.p1 GENE.GHUV01017184.1~~GHUV01017184.1.p1  ORF type:complete len:127 (+),score=32.31 GHUV01017184.1:545-925(+)